MDKNEKKCDVCETESWPSLPKSVTFKVNKLEGNMKRFRTGLRAIGNLAQ